MELEYLLPFLKGIEEKEDYEQQKSVDPGKTLEFKRSKHGYLVDIALISTSPYVAIEHNFWGQKLSYYIYTIYLYGSTAPTTTLHWCSKYDSLTNIYVSAYTPRPYKYFNKDAYIKITAPTADLITGLPIITPTIMTASIHYLEITNLKALKASIQEMNSPAGALVEEVISSE